MKLSDYNKHKWMRGLGLACIGLTVFSGCREDINKDDLYTFTGETVSSFLEKNDSVYGYYVDLLNIVTQSDKTQSSVSKLMSAYGNYTCFAPTNDAIQEFLDSAYVQGKFNSKDFVVFLDSAKEGRHIGDSLAKVIVYNSIIDCGNESAYETAVFPADNGAFALPNMNDRYLTATTQTINGKLEYFVQGTSQVIDRDREVENGYVQGVNKVIAPSMSTVSDLFKDMKNMQFFGELLKRTGWEDSLVNYMDEEYEDLYDEKLYNLPIPTFGTQPAENAFIPEHRKYGFTVFAETDDVLKKELGITDPSQLLEKLSEYLKSEYQGLDNYGELTFGTSDEELKKANNAINQFVAYHLLPVNLPSNKLVIHHNEKGFDLDAAIKQGIINVSIPVFEYYETMSLAGGPRRLLKITESQISGGKRLNRKAIMDTKTYQEQTVEIEGALIGIDASDENSTLSALNGCVYPIDRILVYNTETAQKVLNERLRFDLASLLPELINLGYRRPWNNYPGDKSLVYFPYDFKLKNLQKTASSNVAYSSGYKGGDLGWTDYQGDQIVICGNYDVTLKLPPVPYDGTYEIRWYIAGNPRRGMCQVYFGEEGEVPAPVDIPMDLRMNAYQGLKDLNVGWEEESEDQSYNEEVNKNLRNSKWMKGPRYWVGKELGGDIAYAYPSRVRKILTQKDLKANKTYYMRFKSALDDTNTEFYCDNIEIVPSFIYNNPTTVEDEW